MVACLLGVDVVWAVGVGVGVGVSSRCGCGCGCGCGVGSVGLFASFFVCLHGSLLACFFACLLGVGVVWVWV